LGPGTRRRDRFSILGAFCAGLAIVMLMILPPDRSTVNLILLASSAAGNLYFVVLKHSTLRTFGYRVGRIKIVGSDGNLPSYNSLVWRSLFGLLGPLNWLDSIWLVNDKHSQALRDKFAGTYVVKTDARPAGGGRLCFAFTRSPYITSCSERFRLKRLTWPNRADLSNS